MIQGTLHHPFNMARMTDDIPIEVAEQLGPYVYLYIDPRNDSIQYIGKGVGSRALSHLSDDSDSEKVVWINELKNQGYHLELKSSATIFEIVPRRSQLSLLLST